MIIADSYKLFCYASSHLGFTVCKIPFKRYSVRLNNKISKFFVKTFIIAILLQLFAWGVQMLDLIVYFFSTKGHV